MHDEEPRSRQSKMELKIFGEEEIRGNAHEAHKAANDPRHEKNLPETCFYCWQKQLEAQEA